MEISVALLNKINNWPAAVQVSDLYEFRFWERLHILVVKVTCFILYLQSFLIKNHNYSYMTVIFTYLPLMFSFLMMIQYSPFLRSVVFACFIHCSSEDAWRWSSFVSLALYNVVINNWLQLWWVICVFFFNLVEPSSRNVICGKIEIWGFCQHWFVE